MVRSGQVRALFPNVKDNWKDDIRTEEVQELVEEELINTSKKLKTGKAPGVDRITPVE